MINICENELSWLDMTINTKKSGCIRIGPQFDAFAAKLCTNHSQIEWVTEMPYLGLDIKSGRSFKCSFHAKKTKYYRSINGILGKLGSAPPIGLTLSLISSNCDSIILYGLESLRSTKTDNNALSYPYNSVCMKLFQSFNNTIMTLCQFYCGQLPFEQCCILGHWTFMLE